MPWNSFVRNKMGTRRYSREAEQWGGPAGLPPGMSGGGTVTGPQALLPHLRAHMSRGSDPGLRASQALEGTPRPRAWALESPPDTD